MASDNDQPVYVDHGLGAGFTDVDGFTSLDFNASDLAMFCGHARPAIVAAVQAQVARSTTGNLEPTEAVRGHSRATKVPLVSEVSSQVRTGR